MKTIEATVRRFKPEEIPAMRAIWNEVVEAANAFPQESGLDADSDAERFFSAQDYTAVAESQGKILGLYILHPNNIGRCATIANASYAVESESRGKGIGKLLVEDSLVQGKKLGFRVLQFNAVLKSNVSAIRLYERLGFESLGTIPKCYRKNDGSFEDLMLFFHRL